jgi:nitroreductase
MFSTLSNFAENRLQCRRIKTATLLDVSCYKVFLSTNCHWGVEMSSKTECNVEEGLRWRYATKRFDSSRKIDQHKWEPIEKALVLSPSSYGLQPWKFVVITDQSVKEELVSASYGQKQPKDCSHLVVISRLTELTEEYIEHYIDRMSDVRKVPREKLEQLRTTLLEFKRARKPEQLQDWMSRQCYIALGTLMTTAALHQVDNCPMEGFLPAEYDRILKLPEKGCTSVVLCALGYRADDDKFAQMSKVRFPHDEVIVRI